MPVEFDDRQDDPLDAAGLVALGEQVMRSEGLPETTWVSLAFVGAEEMTRLNGEHMGRDGPTDVLSFPIESLTPGVVPRPDPGGPPIVLGDVVVCPEVVDAQSRAAGVAFDDEMALMIVHGILHLLGYDHVRDDDAEAMEHRERELLALVGRERP
jgi:probable rRNA maturation factor